MTAAAPALYRGEVVHKRLRPVAHKLRYRVFAVLIDCERLGEPARRPRLFSYNRFNLLSLHDRDHGDGTPIAAYLGGLAARMGFARGALRFEMLCYPRILGYAFNPLTVYYGRDRAGAVRLVAYEVNNTFGERMTYVIATSGADGVIAQKCDKALSVSPFNGADGAYSFRVTPPDSELTVGVALRDRGGPVLKAHFRATRTAFTDRALLAALAATGWMTVKVIAAIHWEAARLWLKGMRPVRRPAPPGDRIRLIAGPGSRR